MRFRLETLFVVIAGIAIVIAIGKEIGLIPAMLILFLSGFLVPAFVPNFWPRAGVAFAMTGLWLWVVIAIAVFQRSAPGDGPLSSILYSMLIAPAPLLLTLSAAAVAFSSLLRWGCRQYLDYRSVLEVSQSEQPQQEDADEE